MKRIACVWWMVFFLAAMWPAAGELWTNQAGRVIEARIREFDGAWVTLERTNGAALRMPLNALSKPDQRRVRMQAAQSVAPDFVLAAYQDAVSVLRRFDQMPDYARTPEARDRAVNMACTVYDARIRARSAELKDKEVADEVKRLRMVLASGGS